MLAGRKIASKELSSTELTKALLARTDAIDENLHAYIRLLRDEALASAKAADEAVANGDIKGPLHGVPVALKDIIDLEGVHGRQHIPDCWWTILPHLMRLLPAS